MNTSLFVLPWEMMGIEEFQDLLGNVFKISDYTSSN
jgi:hypothetical protein